MSEDAISEFLKDLPPLRDVIAAHDLQAQKSLGQNFLLDQNITDKIAGFLQKPHGIHAVEIGPGPGGLTRSLLRAGVKSVTAIEYDSRAVCALQDLQEKAQDRLHIHHGDALESDIHALLPHAPKAIVANLPYNVATPLLIRWLHEIRLDHDAYACMILMFQREVADRITAMPNTKAYGRLSVMSQWLCHVSRVYDLPPSAFTPPPKVSSSIVMFTPKTHVTGQPSFKTMEKLLSQAFQQRRKMIRASLKPYLPQIESVGIASSLRAENLSVSDYVAFAQALEDRD